MDDLSRLLVQQACRDLIAQAARFADTHQPARFAALFAEDAVLCRPGGQPIQGRVAIEQAYAARPADRITRHLVTNTVVAVESATAAHAHSNVLLWAGSATDAPGPQGRPAQATQLVGEFDDRFVLTAQGWRIARRDACFVLHLP